MKNLQQLRPEMGREILKHLGTMEALPKFGVLAGQAVSSAIDDLYGKGGGVYNDLDVFLPSSGVFVKNENTVSNLACRGNAQIVDHIDYNGSVSRHLELMQTYQIEGVRYCGLINKIYFRLPDSLVLRADNHTERVVSGFDINAVRVGIDLKSGLLYWDKFYEQFRETRELRIAACYTPAHSLIRLLKKSQELSDVTMDLETAARITGMLQCEAVFDVLSDSHVASYFFGDKFAKLAQTFTGRLSPYYTLDDAWFHRQNGSSAWQMDCGDETSLEAKRLNRLTTRGTLESGDEAFAEKLGLTSVVLLPEQVYRQRDQRSKGFVTVLCAPVPKSLEGTVVELFATARGGDYFLGIEEDSHAQKRLSTFVAGRKGAKANDTLGSTATEQLAISEQLDALAKELKVPDALELLLDNGFIDEMGKFDEVLQRQRALSKMKLEREPLHLRPLGLPPPHLPLPSMEGLAIFELSSIRNVKEFAALAGICLTTNLWSCRFFAVVSQKMGAVQAMLRVTTDSSMAVFTYLPESGRGVSCDALLNHRFSETVGWFPRNAIDSSAITSEVDWLEKVKAYKLPAAHGLLYDRIRAICDGFIAWLRESHPVSVADSKDDDIPF